MRWSIGIAELIKLFSLDIYYEFLFPSFRNNLSISPLFCPTLYMVDRLVLMFKIGSLTLEKDKIVFEILIGHFSCNKHQGSIESLNTVSY